MIYTAEEVYEFVKQEDVKFIRLAFCDVKGRQKNISIMPDELPKAFSNGISIDASAIDGFGTEDLSDLLLFPIPSTLNVLPWRPSHGKVVRMFCNIVHPNNTPFKKDSRKILSDAVAYAVKNNVTINIGTEFEFYLFKTDENGNPTKVPFDNAGYMDVAPEDKGENVRREICLTLLNMGIHPESSHHEEGPGQNEIDFKYSDPISAADNAVNFVSVVKATATGYGLYADFSPKPLKDKSGNGMHVNISAKDNKGTELTQPFMAGILAHIKEITAFLNTTESSYERLGKFKAPKYITWSPENRSQLIRIPAAKGNYKRMELRSPDPLANPYLAYALLIYAGMDGIKNNMKPMPPVNENLYSASDSTVCNLDVLPETYEKAVGYASNSSWLRSLPIDIDAFLCK